MRSFFGFAAIMVILVSCDDDRVYEKNLDFNSRTWLVNDRPEFEFGITDTVQTYNLYCNVRNSLEYPFARMFITYYLKDSSGNVLEKQLVRQMLFDEKTGEPLGESGLGDIYDHRIALKNNHRFPYAGKYQIAFEQFMRTDTLAGVLAIGVRVEKTSSQ